VRGIAVAVALLLGGSAAAARADEPKVSGRVFARQTLRDASLEGTGLPWRWEQQIASARLTVEYRHKKTIKTVIEVDFSDGDASLKDAYVRWRMAREWTLQAGRFKRPFSAVQLEGLWTLPVVERGLLSDLEFNTVALPMGGRSDGISLAWDPKASPVSFQLAAFQPDLLVTVDATEHVAADVYARAEMAVADDVTWGTTLAFVSYFEKPDQQEGFRHAPIAGLDLTYDRGPIRVWADVATGVDVLPFAIDVATLDLPCELDEDGGPGNCPPVELKADGGLFFAARIIASGRVKTDLRWLRTIEPFITASIVDLNTRFKDDEANEIGGGVAVRVAKPLRIQLQADHTNAGSEAPVNEVTRVMLQLGAVF